MYGLPKAHKPEMPLRPIISIDSFSYLAKIFLVQTIQPLTYNEYTISNSPNFVNETSQLKADNSTTMACFIVEPLFTSYWNPTYHK